jgi:hypothetical protein
MKYVVIYERGPQNWGAFAPDLPGYGATAGTLDELRELVREGDTVPRRGAPPRRRAGPGANRDRFAAPVRYEKCFLSRPRAMAFEHRIAAGIADPGVYDVSTAWYAHLPPPLIALINDGQKDTFDQVIASDPKASAEFAFRARPFGISSPFDVYAAVKL